jgi:hypothetical protein
MIYMVFVGDRNNGQVDLGAWMIEDMHPERLDFAVFYSHQHTGSEGSEGSDNTCRGLVDTLLASPTSFLFEKVELPV